MSRYYVTTAIPYVNGRPHVGHALELVQVDVLARHRRQRGFEVRAQTGTDDNALKNVRGAEAEGIEVTEYVARMADGFVALGDALGLEFDHFIHTSSDPLHLAGVHAFWAACAERGDFYRKVYRGRYCVGCEVFYQPDELVDGRCREHGTVPEVVEEENWFFRLSRYQSALESLLVSDVVRIEPASRKREVLAFVRAGLEDFSVSRSTARARGWGIPVPGDPSQVVYVWFDALTNYVTGTGYGTTADFERWWGSSGERVHVIGKGIIRFHAVYWPAMLLSAGLPLPTTIFVHEYLTAGGAKISKSLGNAADPVGVVERYGADALRWWLLRDVARGDDTDYTDARLVLRANEDLANNIGNLVNRTVSMVRRYRSGVVPRVPAGTPDAALVGGPAAAAHADTPAAARAHNSAAAELRAVRASAAADIDDALAVFDFRRAAEVVTRIGHAGNRYVEAVAPWALAKAGRDDELDVVLAELVATCRELGAHLTPFLPRAAALITAQCGGEVLPAPQPVFPRLQQD